ncbi:hypothetical protein [Hydrogenophaga atypica]|uniref:Tetratricopeptide repeat protein n=1 Tax=Hydrogenophaga atypica TaxID=249409 RepID=A0ABW2QQV8_9BURK
MRNASLQEIMFPRQGVGKESKISSNPASSKDFTYTNTTSNDISTKTITNSDQETAQSAQPTGALSQLNTQEKLAVDLTESLRVQVVNAKNSGAILLTWILQHPTRLPEINQIKLQLENLPNKPINGDRIAAKKFNEQGLRLMKLDQIDDAISSFRNGTEADPSDPEIKDNFVTALIAGKQFSAAEGIAGDILTHHPRMASAWFNLSEIYTNQGKPSEATNALIASYQLSDQKNEVKEAIRANTLDINSPIHDAAKKSMKVIELL